MTNTPAISPPPELVQRWGSNAVLLGLEHSESHWAYEQHIATRAAQWGAEQELEACCELMDDWGLEASDLRVARRPKPPSLKEQALALINDCTDPEGDYLDDNALSIIRRALEQLDD
jgi:hypothetical protein